MAPTCFGVETPSSGSALSVLAKVTAVDDVAAYACRSYFNVFFLKLKLFFKTIIRSSVRK